jgi:hypothetical protein
MKNASYYNDVKNLVTNASTKEVSAIGEDIYSLLEKDVVGFIDIIPIVKFVLDRINTMSMLIQQGLLWDSEIIFRSVLEVFIKFLNIISQPTQKDIDTKLDEFWTVLDEIERVRFSDKAKEILNSNRILNLEYFEKLILTEEEEIELKAKPSWANRVYRTSLKNDWSFSGIIIRLMQEDEAQMTPLVSFPMLQFYYKLASHVAHADRTGISMVKDNESKTGEYKAASELTHYIKLIKMVVQIPFWVSIELAKHLHEREKVNEILSRYRKYTQYILSLHQPVFAELERLTSEAIKKTE